jgi:hypothetical protein
MSIGILKELVINFALSEMWISVQCAGYYQVKIALFGPLLGKNNLHKQKHFCFCGSIFAPLYTKTGPQNLFEKCSDAPHIPSSTRTFRDFC